MLRVLAAVLVLWAWPALAAGGVCPLISFGWAVSFPPPLTSASYDTSSELLYVILNNQAHAFSNVPLSVIQGFSRTKDPVGYYNSFVLPSFHELLLAESNNCPLLYQTGAYIWTD